MLVVKHISYTQDGVPFEYNESVYLGSKFSMYRVLPTIPG